MKCRVAALPDCPGPQGMQDPFGCQGMSFCSKLIPAHVLLTFVQVSRLTMFGVIFRSVVGEIFLTE